MAASSVETPENNIVQEASRPKSEEPPQNFFDIPDEVSTSMLATGVHDDLLSEHLRNDIPPMDDLAPAVDNNIVHEASENSNSLTTDPNPVEPRTIVIKKKLFKTPKEREIQAAENERRLQQAGEIFRQSLITKSPTPVITQSTRPPNFHHDGDVEFVETGHQSSPIELDTEAEEASAAARFKSLKRGYERKKKKGQNTVEDDISFSKARNAEEQRVKLKSRKRAYKDVDSEIEIVEDDDALFLAEENSSTPLRASRHDGDLESSAAPKRRKPCRPNRIPGSALQDAMQIGRDTLEREERKAASKKHQLKGPVKKKAPKDPKPRKSKSKDMKSVEGAPKSKGGRPRKGPQMLNIQTLFNNDIVSAAQANVGKAAQPGFTSKIKKDALAELIASIPEDERTTHNADKNALDKATRSFTGHAAMKADGNNGWRLRGMQTSLYHYQLLGAAFMRDRENSSTLPHGGLQSDEMGLGKTVTCLANIVDGQAPPNSPNRTTLIVCPAGLCSQWLNEIKKHVHSTTFQEVIVYRAGARVESTDPTKTLSNADIIITSYGEVMRSYPRCKTPMHLVTSEAKAEWWRNYFKAECGVLHRIFFRRIVLDEGG